MGYRVDILLSETILDASKININALHDDKGSKNEGETFLALAIKEGRDDIVHLLLERGASARLQVRGYMPLQITIEVAEPKRINIVEALLKAGADPTTVVRSGSPRSKCAAIVGTT